jgi:hypothetical protein
MSAVPPANLKTSLKLLSVTLLDSVRWDVFDDSHQSAAMLLSDDSMCTIE